MTFSDFIVYFGASLTLMLRFVKGVSIMLENSFHNYIGRRVIKTDDQIKHKQSQGLKLTDRTKSELTVCDENAVTKQDKGSFFDIFRVKKENREAEERMGKKISQIALYK